MEARNVRLYAVLHEELGADEFKPFLKGEVFLDDKVKYSSPTVNHVNL